MSKTTSVARPRVSTRLYQLRCHPALHTMTGRTGSIAFNIADIPARQVAAELDARNNIAVRGGVHCAPMLHTIIGTGERGAVRASPSSWNTNAEIDTFLEATARIASVGV